MSEQAIRQLRVLDEDPDLGGTLSRERFEEARQVVVAPVEAHPAGPWSTRFDVSEPGALGLLVLDGVVSVQITAERRTNLELLGACDIARPWTEVGLGSVPAQLDWTIRLPARIAFLDARFARAALVYPEIMSRIMDRLVARTRGLSLLLALNAIPRLHDRVLLALWHFADRWARVTPRGVELRLPLSHADLSHVVGASRPSVSTAVSQLRGEGLLEPIAGGGWLLLGEPPPDLLDPRQQVALPTEP